MAWEIKTDQKAKVAIVNDLAEILVLRRSKHEDTRRGEWDWPGGTLEPRETPEEALLREVQREELRGVILDNVISLRGKNEVKDDGTFKVTYLSAATAKFPPEGIVLSREHDDYDWVSPDVHSKLAIPNKYKHALILGASVIEELAQLYQIDGSQAPREPAMSR